MKKIKIAALVVGLSPVMSTFATATGPIDLTATGTSIVTYIGEGGLAAVGVFGALYGLRMIVRAFRAVK
ncbi:MAG TPA: hypothetical protein VGI60_14595 [Chthoniobacterales bacterium]|jgi:hypothetical protein